MSITDKATILIVEDDNDVRAITRAILENYGHRVIEAADAVDGLKQLELNTDIQLLFSDIMMPNGINGFELAQTARSLRPDLVILLTSGYPESELSATDSKQSNHRLLRKPYSAKELIKAITAMLPA